jgi:hypothetical protein
LRLQVLFVAICLAVPDLASSSSRFAALRTAQSTSLTV